jgi:hypothetical protein
MRMHAVSAEQSSCNVIAPIVVLLVLTSSPGVGAPESRTLPTLRPDQVFMSAHLARLAAQPDFMIPGRWATVRFAVFLEGGEFSMASCDVFGEGPTTPGFPDTPAMVVSRTKDTPIWRGRWEEDAGGYRVSTTLCDASGVASYAVKLTRYEHWEGSLEREVLRVGDEEFVRLPAAWAASENLDRLADLLRCTETPDDESGAPPN